MAPVRFYQRFISPALPASCRYYPTCSAYAVTALKVHGPLKGLLLALWRLLRCNPVESIMSRTGGSGDTTIPVTFRGSRSRTPDRTR